MRPQCSEIPESDTVSHRVPPCPGHGQEAGIDRVPRFGTRWDFVPGDTINSMYRNKLNVSRFKVLKNDSARVTEGGGGSGPPMGPYPPRHNRGFPDSSHGGRICRVCPEIEGP
jgi:hypothetical protein